MLRRFLGENRVLYAILILIIVLTLVSTIIAIMPTNTPYSPFNNNPQGYSKLTEILKVRLTRECPGSLEATIIPLLKPLSESEALTLIEYVGRGGTLLILDNGGFSNIILRTLGLNVTVNSYIVLDPAFNLGSRFDIIAYSGSLKGLALSTPKAINVSDPRVTVLAYSSPLSYIDINGNNLYDVGEPLGPFPLAIKVYYGEGVILIVGDPMVFSNKLIDRSVNTKLAEDLGLEVSLCGSHASYSILDYIKSFHQASAESEVTALTALVLSLSLALVVLRVAERS
ncbi:MAG: DUF4350 domain-containing protein [Acidilobaceae archaeon]